MAGRKAPSPFALLYGASVLGALVVVAVDPLAGVAVLTTGLACVLVVCLVQAERAQGRYRRLLAAKVATRPWSEADVPADEEALIAARKARLAASLSRPVHEHYDTPGAPQRVVIERHGRIEEAAS